MKIKYIVKSDTSPHLYLAANVKSGNRTVPYAFKPCPQVIYEAAEFGSKEEAVAACEEAAKYYGISHLVPVILKIVAK